MSQGVSFLIPQQLGRIKYLHHALSSSSSNSKNHGTPRSESFHTSATRSYVNHALSMKYSICNTQLLPKAADLKKKAFDEFRLNISAIVLLKLLSQNAMKSFLTSSVQVSVSLAKKPGDSGYEIGNDRKTRQRTIRKVMVGIRDSKSQKQQFEQ